MIYDFETRVSDDGYFQVGLREVPNYDVIDCLEIEDPRKYNCSIKQAILDGFELEEKDVDKYSLTRVIDDIHEHYEYN